MKSKRDNVFFKAVNLNGLEKSQRMLPEKEASSMKIE
jgi:hypothetical protein